MPPSISSSAPHECSPDPAPRKPPNESDNRASRAPPHADRLWYFSTNPDLLERIRSHTRADVNTLGMAANWAVLREGDEWLDEVRPYIQGNHELTERTIAERMPLVGYRKAQATYLAWIDVSRVIERLGANRETGTDVAQRWFAENAGVFLTLGRALERRVRRTCG